MGMIVITNVIEKDGGAQGYQSSALDPRLDYNACGQAEKDRSNG